MEIRSENLTENFEVCVTGSTEGSVYSQDMECSSRCNSPEPISEAFLRQYKSKLAPYEEREILLYDKIYYLSKNPPKFSDNNGNFIGASGDHIAYRYEILNLLGQGSFGKVFQCFDHKTHELLALKVINNNLRFLKYGKKESALLEKLTELDSSGCILRKFSSFEFRGHFVIVFEILSLNLYQLNKSIGFRGMSLEKVRKIAEQILTTLKIVHNAGFIHCDLKPENILLKTEEQDAIKIIDYGSACCTSEDLLEYVQSRAYRAPEVVLGCKYSEKIDIWSLGCILVECVTGKRLFSPDSEKDLLLMMQETLGKASTRLISKSPLKELYFKNGVVPGQPSIKGGKGLEAILEFAGEKFVLFVRGCLEWDPEERLSAESALKHSWITQE